MFDYGHKYACANIRLENDKRRRGDRTSNCHETAEERSNAKDLVKLNASVPALVFRGEILRRRFRKGQRVRCLNPLQGWNLGTVTDLQYSQEHDSPLLSYEIEMDNGMYCSAPADNDECIRREIGAPVVTESNALPPELATAVAKEMEDGWIKYNAASSLKRWEKLNRRICSGCGKRSKKKLPVCIRCDTAAYCNVECQSAHYADHKKACRDVVKRKKEFVGEHSEFAASREGRRFIKSVALDSNRYKTLETFLLEKLGLPYGISHFLKGIVHGAVDASRSKDPATAMVALAKEKAKEDPFVTLMFTTDQLTRIIAAMIHFSENAPDLAQWCAAVIDLFVEISRYDQILYPAPQVTGGRYCYSVSCAVREDAEGVAKRFCSKCREAWYCSKGERMSSIALVVMVA